jgi:hypothetical protein
MHRKFALVVVITLGTTAAAFAQQLDERAAQAACQDDALRLCQATIPDRERTLACLVHNKAGLSGACRTVLAEFISPDKSKRAKRPPANRTSSASN